MKSPWSPQTFTKDARWVGKAGTVIVLLLAGLLPALVQLRRDPEFGLMAGVSTSLISWFALFLIYKLPLRRMETIAVLSILAFLMAAASLALGITTLASMVQGN